MDDTVRDASRVRIIETEPAGETADLLIRMSEEWEAENSCRGYRRNTAEDISGRRVFLAFSGETAVGYLFGQTEKTERRRRRDDYAAGGS